MGRKPVAAEFKRSERVSAMLTPAELEKVEKDAAAAGAATLSDYIRDKLLS